MQSLEKIIDWLNESPKHYIEVYNDDTGSRYGTRFNATQVDEAFFVDLKNKGFNTVSIQRIKNNGSTYPRLNEAQQRFNLGTNQPKEVVGGREQNANAAPTSQHQPQHAVNPLGMMGGTMGLSAPQILDNYTKAQQFAETKSKLDKAEEKIKKLEEEKEDLKYKNLRHEFGLDAKPGISDKLIDALQKPEILQFIGAIAQAKAGNGATVPSQGLNAAGDLSEIKLLLIQGLQHPEVTDDMAQMAFAALQHCVKGNEAFIEAFDNLLNQYQQQPTN